MVAYNTLKIREQRKVIFIQFYRPDASNAINELLLEELMSVLLHIQSRSDIAVVVLEGLPKFFCTGLDFELLSGEHSKNFSENDPRLYYEVLNHLSDCPQTIISKVEGKVNAGGIGFIAASDIVIAGENATFGLSEALFGLLPACVLPFLIRRIGYQKALWMTLISQGISAQRAFQIGLVDEFGADVEGMVRKNLLRLNKLNPATIKELKSYMNSLWITNEETQALATKKISTLVNSDLVKENIRNFVNNGSFPWEKL